MPDARRAIDDRVVGGVSRSHLRHDRAGHAVFEGEASLAQHGGFASVRSSPGERGQAGANACLIEARGVANQVNLSLLTDDGFDSVNYQARSTDIEATALEPANEHSPRRSVSEVRVSKSGAPTLATDGQTDARLIR